MNEIEVKARVKDFNLLMNNLKKLDCVFSELIIQDDYIYNKKGLDIKSEYHDTPVLRIRKQNNKILFTLKKNRSNELDCIEKEIEINNDAILTDIIELLDYVKTVEVHKSRIKTNYKEYEICLDSVKNLGDFIEVEKKSDENGEKIQNELFDFLQTIGIEKEDRVFKGYDTLLCEKDNI